MLTNKQEKLLKQIKDVMEARQILRIEVEVLSKEREHKRTTYEGQDMDLENYLYDTYKDLVDELVPEESKENDENDVIQQQLDEYKKKNVTGG